MSRVNSPSPPWYKQRWPWILMSLPAVSVVLGSTLLYFAITTNDGLVVDDYYRQGRAIDQTIARATHASELGLVADMSIRSEAVSIRLTANEEVELPAELLVSFLHPTRAGFDQMLRLPQAGDGEYSGGIAPLSIGRWRIQIEDGEREWRLHGDAHVPDRTQVQILPYEG